ncbi:MAG: flagellar protein FlaG [Campylobacterales bacterium]|nr:flagellar protein FlaG [Campylobacterales bacterium]
MEIFSAVGKQMDAATTVKPSSSAPEARQVEQTNAPREVAKDAQTQNAQDKKEIQQQLTETVRNLNTHMESLNTNISFGFNDKIESLYVSVMEKSSGKTIRKIPTEEAMKLSEHFREIIGLIFDKKG